MSSNKIEAIAIFEILGRPPEHLKETLEILIGKINEEEGIKVKDKKINEPKLLKDEKDLYTTFVEVEIEFDEFTNLLILMFKYMPAHIEIVSPEKISIKINKWNQFLNELARRLHNYDEVARILQTEKMDLEKKLKEVSDKEEKTKESDKK